MKTERRHELQENELAHLLVDQAPTANPYVKIGLGVAVLLAALWVAVSYVRSRSEAQQEAAWSAYYDAVKSSDVEELRQVAQTFPGTVASGWALDAAGDLLLNQGIGQLFRDKEQATKQLEAARDTYQGIVSTFTGEEMLAQRAMLGLAKAQESLGDLTEAAQSYEAIGKKWPGDEFAKIASERLQAVQQPRTKEWYSWFVQQKPVANAASDPSLFQDLPNLPNEPDLKMPKPGELLGPSGNGPDASSTELPGSESAPPDGAAPSNVPGSELPGAELPGSELPAAELPGAELPGSELPATGSPVPSSPAPTSPEIPAPDGAPSGASSDSLPNSLPDAAPEKTSTP